MSQLDNWSDSRRQFLLAPDEVYLNAGTFSALPRPVYDELVKLGAAAEANPTRQAAAWGRAPLWEVQKQIAHYVGADPEDIVFHKNVTQALNQALVCLPWPADGEFIASDEEYGAIGNAAREMCRRRGLRYRTFPVPLQPRNGDELLEVVLNALTPATVGVLLSHVTCITGIVFPVARIATELRRRGVRLIVDGAHGPGLLPLQLAATDIDIYGGNLHKWLMGPKGTAFLYVARRLQDSMQPHIVGWGGTPQDAKTIHDEFPGPIRRFQYIFRMQGLQDFAPFLALGATLRFREFLGEEPIRERISFLDRYVRSRITLKCLSPATDLNAGLVTFEPPPAWQTKDATERMYCEHKITVPFGQTDQHGFWMRVSPHIWNSEADVDRLAKALESGK